MADHNVRSFVEKFHHLWRDGQSAHLNLDCHAGEAWVGLRLRLGQLRGGEPQQNPDKVRRRGPGYSRRLERRAAQRAAAAAEPQAQTVEPVPAEQAQTGVDQVETEPVNVQAGKADAAAVKQVEADLTEQVVTEAVKLVENEEVPVQAKAQALSLIHI